MKKDAKARERRLIVLDGLKFTLDQGDKANERMRVPEPKPVEQTEALAGIADGLTRQVDKQGEPEASQVEALARACVLWLERQIGRA